MNFGYPPTSHQIQNNRSLEHMNRKDFVKLCGILGIGVPFQFSLNACSNDDVPNPQFNGRVVIIGAGAGGMSAGYLLSQLNIDFEILEASSINGGRMRIDTDFADFPIPLGAEWLETNAGVLGEIVNDSSVQVDIETVSDTPDLKFVNSSWYSFFQEYILPSVSSKITYNTVVESIDYSNDQVVVRTANQEYTADRVIVAVPLRILQLGNIHFTPQLPTDKLNAINSPIVWEGFKAFFEFSTDFYGEGHTFNISPETDGQKIYYNASLGQNTTKNILGLFTVGRPAQDLITKSGDELRDFILNELDGLFNNQATPNYVKHITQNWNDEPYIQGGYLTDHANWRTVRTLGEPVADKVYFAGGAYTDGEDWVSVHLAAKSAREAVTRLTN